MKRGPQKTVGVVMPLELYEAIKGLAEEDARSIPSYIRLVLREHIEQKNSVPPQEDGKL
ncbi:MAG: toxin-antitoxin system protein [Lawsonibacter sp.]|jgi:hypothetical protein|nr:toxin-antitoxin system protein [Lawsonibacter sp.]